jgi:hypothetical protein
VKRLTVAAGGGGDAVAAALLHAALYGEDDDPGVVLAYSWDRLLVDPVPGPRTPADFTGLHRLTPNVWAVPGTAAPRAPYGSTLTRLAAELPHTIALIDPSGGVVGIARQIGEVVRLLRPEAVDLLDVGGDILAHGDEPTLRSPLADALTLAACAQVDADVRLLVAGPGLDGELSADLLRDRLGPAVATFAPGHVEAIAPVLRWHPSEATALLAAAACGVRGLCEVRDAGILVPLTDEGPRIYQPDLGTVFKDNALAAALAGVGDFGEAEQICRRVCGACEVDYERAKATRLPRLSGDSAPDPSDEALRERIREFEAAARARGATYVTVRRIAEALRLRGAARERLLGMARERQTANATAPFLWRLTALKG